MDDLKGRGQLAAPTSSALFRHAARLKRPAPARIRLPMADGRSSDTGKGNHRGHKEEVMTPTARPGFSSRPRLRILLVSLA